MHNKHLLYKYCAEALGTCLLIVFGAGSVVVNFLTDGKISFFGIALAHALIIGIGVYLFDGISGAHFNPAVTIAFLFHKMIDKKNAAYYIAFQLLGSVIGALILKLLFAPVVAATALGAPQIRGIAVKSGFWMEFIITFLLVLVVMYITKTRDEEVKKRAPLFIGAVILLGIMFAGPFTGGAINPARAFGPALIANFWYNHLLYWIAPILGAIAAVYASNLWWRKEKN